MGRPRVTIHNLISVDGRLDGFPAEVSLYYELVAAIPHQAILSGSGTMLAAAAAEGIDGSGQDLPPSAGDSPPWDASLPWLVIVDSRGRLRRLGWLRSSPHWRDVLVLCSDATPAAHLDRLRGAGVRHEVIGDARVDLRAALQVLSDRYEVRSVRVDAGPGLTGALLRAGLVDELSLVVAPYAVGGGTARALRLFGGPDHAARPLRLASVRPLRDDHVWLRYTAPGAA